MDFGGWWYPCFDNANRVVDPSDVFVRLVARNYFAVATLVGCSIFDVS